VTKDGEFVRKGNILEDHPNMRDVVGFGQEELGSHLHFLVSRNSKGGMAPIPTTEIPALTECSLKLGWDVKADRHAALVMIDASRHQIIFEGRLHKFIQNLPHLTDKAFVTKVYRCSAYALLLTEYGRFGKVYVGFRSNDDSTSATTPAGGDRAWQTYSPTGIWNIGTYQPSAAPYTPLVTLKQIRPKESTMGFRDWLPPEITDTEEMRNYIPPWGDLDEHGDELYPDD